MNVVQIVAGIVAGVVGAAVWAAIAHFANLEVGYVAWGIGLLVGLAVAATGKNGMMPGVAAVLITVVAILAGKFAAMELAFGAAGIDTGAIMEEIRGEGEKALVRSLADNLANDKMAAGEALEWPAGMSYEDASEPADYPPGIWQAAEKEWNAKTAEEKTAATEAYYTELEGNMAAGMQVLRQEGFLSSFGMFDLLFFGLAIFTSWGIASRDADGA